MPEFWRFKAVDETLYTEIPGVHNTLLVWLSIAVAALATYAALTVLERIWAAASTSTGGQARNFWLWFGAFVMGVGVWAMHFTGMLAYNLPMPMSYNAFLTLISSLPAIVGAYVALRLLADQRFGFWWIQAGALALGLGIVTMHYLGMASLQVNAVTHYDPVIFIASVVTAHVLTLIALYVRVLVETTEDSSLRPRLASAVVMGAAVAGTHYMAMASVSYYVARATALAEVTISSQSVVLALIVGAFVAIFVGITVVGAVVDRRLEQAEEMAKKSELRKKVILETMADGLVVIDENGRIETFNSAGAAIFRRPAVSVIGQPIEMLMPSISYRNLMEDAHRPIKNIIGKTIEVDGVRADGETFPAEVTFSQMFLEFNVVIRDITRRRMLEQQLRQSQKLESIGQLAAGIAHEINTPTQYISDNTAFLKKAFARTLEALHLFKALVESDEGTADLARNGEAREVLKKIKLDFLAREIPRAIDQSMEGLNRVASIVSAMKSFSHPGEQEKVLLNLKDAIETTLTIARNEWKYVADVEVDIDPDLAPVPCLRDEFNQVILNMVVNSAHAIAETLDAGEKEKGKIKIAARSDGDSVIITIADDGNGIPREIQQKIFDPFFTTKAVGKGTGQGLSIVYSVIVDKHGGEVSVQSEVGKGTTFTLRLPLQDEAPEQTVGVMA